MFASSSSTQTDILKWSALFLFTGTLAYTGYNYIAHLNKKIEIQAKKIEVLNAKETSYDQRIHSLTTKLRKTEDGKKKVVQNLRIEKIIKNLFKLGTHHLEKENSNLKMQIDALDTNLKMKDIQLSGANKQIELLQKKNNESSRYNPIKQLPLHKLQTDSTPPKYSWNTKNTPSFQLPPAPLTELSQGVVSNILFPSLRKALKNI